MTEPEPGARPYRICGNVFLDLNSSHRWDDLIQRDFLVETFASLEALGATEASDLRFYVFSPFHADQLPASMAYREERKVLIFLSDEADSITPIALSPHYVAIFKPSQRTDRVGDNIFTMSLGLANGVPASPAVPMAERRLDLMFTGNLNRNRYPVYFAFHPMLRPFSRLARSKLVHLLLRSPLSRLLRRDFSAAAPSPRRITFTEGFGQGLSRAEYGAMLADSRIVLAPRGFVSAETFRHLEALRAGAVVVSDALPDTFLYRGGPFVCVENWVQGLAVVDTLLADPAALAQRQAAGLAWYEAVLSPRATAKHILETVRKVGG